ncbi:MAG: Gfo/Idh/MocA family oxidoreductase [Chloroflexota bacterium]
MTNPLKVGVIGVGNISGIYLKNSKWLKDIDVVAVADLRMDAAKARADEYDIPQTMTVEEMLASDEIDLILNITNPNAHAQVALAAVSAGKSVYSEKPLTLTRDEGKAVLQKAAENNVLVGCAPDTFLGAGHQTARKLIDDGAIGTPVAASAFMMGWGMEMWHPNPEFYFKSGGGPMFDMGPYYLTDLIFMLGPVKQVTGMVTTGRKQRTITSQPLAGQIIDVEVPTHVTGLLEFESGAIGTIITSFDAAGANVPRIEIHGTAGSISVPDPNIFGGSVMLKKPGEDWAEVEHTHIYDENSRGLGLADMAAAIKNGRSHRANGELAYHVLDLMHAFHDAAEQQQHITIESSCKRPSPMPQGLAYGEVG